MELDIKWKKSVNGNNYVKSVDGGYLSYNPSIKSGPMDDFLVAFAGVVARDGKDETALQIDGVWYILNGNFVDEYDTCTITEELLAVFEKYKKEFRSGFSTNPLT